MTFPFDPSRRQGSAESLLSIAWPPSHEGNSLSRCREFSRLTKTSFLSIFGIELGQGKRKHVDFSCAPACDLRPDLALKPPVFRSGGWTRPRADPAGFLVRAGFLLARLLACYIGASIFRQNSIFVEKNHDLLNDKMSVTRSWSTRSRSPLFDKSIYPL